MSIVSHLKRLRISFSPPGAWRQCDGHFSKNWSQKRDAVFKRDSHKCVYCGYRSRNDLHVHHVNRNPNDNRIANLETVCVMCHLILHAGYGSEVLGVLDFYDQGKYSQNAVVLLTRRMRGRGKSDKQIRMALGLRDQRPFYPDVCYLSNLTGFISARVPVNPKIQIALCKMYARESKTKTASTKKDAFLWW